jgi:hypothetical protein
LHVRRGLLTRTAWVIAVALPALASARIDTPPNRAKRPSEPARIFVLDGSTVHNVGELQMHVGNWGLFGSLPGLPFAFSQGPSAQWPAGSGKEYLYGAGVWVGALKNGVPAVSTSLGFGNEGIEFEFRPSQDLRDIMYRASEGDGGGSRLPSARADDDGDGETDEDWLNGFDDDGDGAVDEDFAAISRQMFSCQYRDNEPSAAQIYPQHNPLNLHVRQESFQWEEDRYDDFVGIQFYITNVGNDILQDLYIGFFADGDVGQRGSENYWEDDATGLVRVEADCLDLGPVAMDIAYVYDADGDNGQTPGYCGILFLGHTTDPAGEFAPRRVGISTYANFSGNSSFEDGGDPVDDFQRYQLLSSEGRERNAPVPRDYRMLMAAGPFAELLPGSTLVFQTAFAVGNGLGGLLTNAANAQFTFEGAWFDLDHDPMTGIAGRETRVDGPAENVQVDTCLYPLQSPFSVPRGQTVWINNDCSQERTFKTACGYTEADSGLFQTGIGGAESQIVWILGTAPPPPNMRIDPSAADGVVVYWDNTSQTQPDVKRPDLFDFENYRVFRADNWTRPPGTSPRIGPSTELWKMLFEADIVNGFGRDTGLDHLRYEPLTHAFPPAVRRDLIDSFKAFLTEFPDAEPPCPSGVSEAQCDTLEALAAWELGLEQGRQYYRYVDRSMHRGRPYFYSVVAGDHGVDESGELTEGKVGDPSSNFLYTEPGTVAQPDYRYQEEEVYVVPNPATTASMEPWTLSPNNDDPTGVKVEFRHLPADRGTIRIYTVAGDLVEEIHFDGRSGRGTVKWDLVTRNGQDVTSGVYIFSVETDTNSAFGRKIGKFVVIR